MSFGNSSFGFSSGGAGGGSFIGGGGTLNYISKFSPDGSTIGNSLLYDNGVSVGLGTVTPDVSAKLDIFSTTQGFLAPRMTQTERDLIPSPAIGLFIFNTTSSKFNFWDGAWQTIDSTTAPSELTLAQTLANGNVTGGLPIIISSGDTLNFSVGSGGTLNSSSTAMPRTWLLPDESGTIALLSDITSGSSAQFVQLGSQPATVGAGQPFTYTTEVLSSPDVTASTAVFNPPFTISGTVFTLISAGRYEVNFQMTYPSDGGVVLYFGAAVIDMLPLAYTMIGKSPDGAVSGSVIVEVSTPNSFLSVNAGAGNAVAIAIPPNSSTTNQSATTVSIKRIS